MENKHSTFQKEKDAEPPTKENALVKIADLEKMLSLKEKEVETLKSALLAQKSQLEDDEFGALIVRERRLNNDLINTQKAMINAFSALDIGQDDIGIRRMGEIDATLMENACKMRFADENTIKLFATPLCSMWQEELRNPHWHPFKTICNEGEVQQVVDEKDVKLRNLKRDWGEMAQNAVISALKEMNEYNPNGRTITKELWNFKEGRKATLAEVVQKMENCIRQLKDEVASFRDDGLRIAKRKIRVYTERPEDQEPEEYHIKILARVLGSEEAVKESLVYSYKHGASGFCANLTPDQVSELSKQSGVLRVVPSATLQIHSGPAAKINT